ncbi:YdeI/OmpD-associated family protein [Tenacibaculum caenipelagi]|uniref:Uncharacterized protein DUF1905 n=1 Tax=Tenacibaculum caenipelagi TaxID=1325435 RepID=A0A4R6TCE7_9FLAO|nr:YdeI/OmpD-associated family protein [Tenacibaculum caenipelagi]TDQ25434.1 uncharacterized protein DUF1905 [Tenacibaculum caenipelagi]
MKEFKAKIEIIGINPFVFVPDYILNYIFEKAGKDKGKIPIRIKVEGNEFEQTLIKYSGHWRLYLNTPMRKSAKKEVGEIVRIEIEFDPNERKIPFHPKFRKALNENEKARKIFDHLTPSLQKEILRYLSFLKTEKSIDRNVERAIEFLLGNTRFIGRDKP